MKKILPAATLVLLLCCLCGFTACKRNALSYPNPSKVADLAKTRLDTLGLDSLYQIVQNSAQTDAERHAMNFLYAYMELADMLNQSPQFYLRNVRTSLQARQEMPWGRDIPQEIFMHYVLPVRINNEELDSARMPFYRALKDRVDSLSLEEAALEVNHWCHEYVTYAPSDSRTLSPLATKKNALGRCGEESTFAVAALRSVGIPARQVYTPRWAHTDDNHAWVEVWIDGAWYFMGACEPAAKLNIAWFNSSVARAMLVHTKVFGRLEADTQEEVIAQGKTYTEVNSIQYYTDTRSLTVNVQDAAGRPVPDATVQYTIYNYAEFFPAVTKQTNQKGQCTPLSIGKGDMLVWAFKDGASAYTLSKGREDETLTLTLRPAAELPAVDTFSIVPPQQGPGKMPAVSKEEEQENERRWKEEDAKRKAYEETFLSPNEALDQATGLFTDRQAAASAADALTQARGNHADILDFLSSVPREERSQALRFLRSLSAKDLTDAPAHLLKELFAQVPREALEGLADFSELTAQDSLQMIYVVCPRIAAEQLTPYRNALRALVPQGDIPRYQADPTLILSWMKTHLRMVDDQNPRGMIIAPAAVARYGLCDSKESAAVFFVAMARSLNIPARINPVTGAVEYTLSGNAPHSWVQVDFAAQSAQAEPMGLLNLTYDGAGPKEPKYYSHFSIARITSQGKLSTLYFDEYADYSYRALFSAPRTLAAGTYILTTGIRRADGSVSGLMKKADIAADAATTLPLTFVQSKDDVVVLGSINAEAPFLQEKEGSTAETKIIDATGRGYFVLAVLQNGTEPTNHALKDLERVQAQLNEWGRPMLLLFPNPAQLQEFRKADFPSLPQNITWGADRNGEIEAMIRKAVNLSAPGNRPLVVVADSFGRVVFVREGYTIGLGEQILSILPKL